LESICLCPKAIPLSGFHCIKKPSLNAISPII
jgi:hypothetical protein